MKTAYLVAIAVIIIVVGVVVYSLYTKPVEKGMSGLEIAKISLTYVDIQRNPNGIYNYSSHCEPNCPFEKSYPTTNAWTSLAYLGMYKATNNNIYLGNAKKDADILLNWCEGQTQECLWVLVQISKLYDETKDEKYLNFLKTAGEQLLKTPLTEHVMMAGIEARELAILYALTKDDRYLAESKTRLEKSKELWKDRLINYELDGYKVYSLACWTELAEVELFKVTGSNGYLDNVKAFVEKSKIGESVSRLNSVIEIEPCIEALISLNELTNDPSYKEDAVKMVQATLEDFWDSLLTKKYYGEGMFVSLRTESTNTLTDTAYMVYNIAKLSDESFEVGS